MRIASVTVLTGIAAIALCDPATAGSTSYGFDFALGGINNGHTNFSQTVGGSLGQHDSSGNYYTLSATALCNIFGKNFVDTGNPGSGPDNGVDELVGDLFNDPPPGNDPPPNTDPPNNDPPGDNPPHNDPPPGNDPPPPGFTLFDLTTLPLDAVVPGDPPADPVPAPAGIALFGIGLVSAAFLRRRK